MANTCYNTLRIYGDGDGYYRLVEDLDALYSSHDRNMWIGRLYERNGVSTEKVSLRGTVTFYDSQMAHEGGSFTLDIDSAWAPPYNWFSFIEEHYEGVSISYRAEELGCGIYETNDMELFEGERFLLTFEGGEEYFSTRDEMEEFIKKNEIGETDGSVYELENVKDLWKTM